MDIAFLGLGKMGTGMATCLLRAGHRVRVWNRTPEKMRPLERAGATACASPAAAVDGAPLVITSLMDDASVRELFAGPSGLLGALAANAIHLCVTTISLGCADWLAEQHAAHGSRYVSGPVLGRPDAAAEGSLVQFLAGDASAIAEVVPVCSAFASMTLPMPGPARIANAQKLCMNFAIAALIEVMAEGYTFAEKTGASPQMLAVVLRARVRAPRPRGYASRMAARDIDASSGFSMRGSQDVGLMLDAAAEVGCPLDVATVLQGKMKECVARGLGDADWSAVQEATRARAGLAAR